MKLYSGALSSVLTSVLYTLQVIGEMHKKNVDLIMALNDVTKGITHVNKIHPESTEKVCTKFCGYPSNGFPDFSVKSRIMVEPEDKLGTH